MTTSLGIHGHLHTQETLSSTWAISHGLQCKPVVGVQIYLNGVLTSVIPKDVSYPDDSTVVVTFTNPQFGEARLA